MTDHASNEKPTSKKIIALPSGVALFQMATSSTSDLAAKKIGTFINERAKSMAFSRHRFTRQRAPGQNVSSQKRARGCKRRQASPRNYSRKVHKIFNSFPSGTILSNSS